MALYDNTIVAWGERPASFPNVANIYTLEGTFLTDISLAGSGGGVETQIATRHTDNHVFFEVPGVGFYEFDSDLSFVTVTAHLMVVDFICQLLQFIGTRLWIGGSEADFSTTVYKKNSTSPYATVATYTNVGSSNATRLFEVDPTETYVYFSLANTSTRNVLKRYKFSDASVSTLATYGTWSAGTNTGNDLLSGAVFPNGDIALLISHLTANVVDGVELVIFNSSGSVLHTVTLPITGLSYHVNTRLSYDAVKVFIAARKGATSQYVIQSYLHSDASLVDDFLISLSLMDGSFEVMPSSTPDPIVPVPPDEGFPIPMRRLRRTQTISDEKFWLFYSMFQLDLQTGGPRIGNEPIQICLRYSDNSGNTWSNEMWLDIDHKGEYDQIARWFRLGRGRSRVWEVSCTSRAAIVWLDAYMDAEKGTKG